MVGNTKKRRTRKLFAVGALIAPALLVLAMVAPNASAAPITIVDDGGADDYPGQKDLNFLTVDYGLPGATVIDVDWGWDDTATSGANTRDGCALFDTDGDGKANYSYCVIVEADNSYSTVLYSCGDDDSDKCTNPRQAIPAPGSSTSVDVVEDIDPFGVPSSPDYDVDHVTGNTCGTAPDCYTDDTVAMATIDLDDIGDPSRVTLINVCSYPSQVPGSAPSECVIAANSGFLTIVKVADPDDDTDFVFDSSAPSNGDVSQWTIEGSGQVQFIPFASGNTLDLDEVVPDGWELDEASCELQLQTPTSTGTPTDTGVDNITIQAGVETICTFEDSLAEGTLTLVKTVTNDNGGTLAVADFPLFMDATSVTSGQTVTFVGGTQITASETQQPGYTASAWGGHCAADGSVTIEAGVDKTCTITNDDNEPTLRLRKTVTNDNGGTALATAWTLTADGALAVPTDLSGSTPVNSGTGFKADTYTLGESGGPSGYTAGDWSCVLTGTATPVSVSASDEVVVGLGDDITCTIDNDDNEPTLRLRKTVTNDNGGTALATAWTLTADGALAVPTDLSGSTPVNSGTGFKADTYTLGESGGPSGYTAGDWSCVLTGTATPVSVSASDEVVVGLGDDITCTIDNDDNEPTLRLRKTVTNDNGGTALATAWTLTADGALAVPTDLSGSTPVNSGTGFKADTYTLGESGGPSGYTAGDWSCVLTGTATPVSVSASDEVVVGLGDDITCTIDNDDNEPTLRLRKTVTNDNGGTALATAWTLTADGALAVPTDLSGSTPVNSGTGFKADTYTLGESGGPSGYTAGDWSCVLTGTATPVSVSASDEVVVGLGDDITCTIDNDDNEPTLRLRKTVTNDNGGTALATAWTLTADGALAVPTDLSGSTPVNSGTGFKADTYTLGESGGPSGYTAGDWSCVLTGTATPVSVSASDEVVVGLGDDITCTIDNDDNEPTLRLRKTVTNDNGGTALATAWTLTADGALAVPTDLSGSTPVNSGTGFKADTYTLGESGGPSGYTAGDWSCVLTGTATPVSVSASDEVVVGLGDDITCTIDNDDNEPTLRLRKTVTNDNGGTALATAWTLTADGALAVPTDLSGSTPVNSGTGFKADTYTLGESGGPSGYTAGDWSCVLTGTATPVSVSASDEVVVGLGDDITCTIDNDDNEPTLRLRKTVTNDNGGTALATAWTLTADGALAVPTDLSGSTPVNSGTGFKADTYTLGESGGPSGYTAGDWSCVLTGTATPVSVSASDEVVVGLGDDITCTIDNDDDEPSLTLEKTVSGGSATEADFTLIATGPTSFQGPGPSVSNGPSFDAGTYALSETGPAGYSPSAWSCVGGTQDGSNITVGLGESATCSITNTRDQGSITAVKYHDLNGDGTRQNGEPDLEGWEFWVDLNENGEFDPPAETKVATGANGQAALGSFDTDTYWVCEVTKSGWVNSQPGSASVSNKAPCVSITVTKDSSSTATFGNYQRTKIQVNKTVSNGPVPDGVTFQFQIREGASTTSQGTTIATGSVTGPDSTLGGDEWTAAAGQQYPLDPGTDYQLCEQIYNGYTPSFVVMGQYGTAWFHPGLNTNDPNTSQIENEWACYDLADVVSGVGGADNTVEIAINNQPQGMARTIGFWKNWTSCDGKGNQAPVLDQTLFAAGSIQIGDLILNGGTQNSSPDCQKAIRLLNKSTINTGKKKASDPAFNMTAQLLAYRLNQVMSPTSCSAAASAATEAQAWLDWLDFNGISHRSISKALASRLNYLSGVLDDYNNNSINCSAFTPVPTPPGPPPADPD